MSFRRENEGRDEASGDPLDEGFPLSERAPEERGRRRSVGRASPAPLPLTVGLVLLALGVGGVLLWLSYGDRAGGTSVFEDSIESGPEPVVRLSTGAGQVRIAAIEGLENVEMTAERYARGLSPAGAKENAANLPVDVTSEGSTIEISSEGGRGTGVDYDLRVPPGSTVEVESSVGDVEVSGLAADATVRAEGGDITLRDVRGSIVVEAPQGDVSVESVGTETGNAEIAVGFGDVELEDLVVGLLEAEIEAGDVTMSGRFSGGGRIFVETGSINASLPSEDVRDLDLETRVGKVVREGERQ